MEDRYEIADDVSNYVMNGRMISEPIPLPVPGLLSAHHDFRPAQNYSDMVLLDRPVTNMFPGGGGFNQDFRQDSNFSGGCYGGMEFMETVGGLVGDGGTGRWPRQETLTLLEIRSRLDYRFKESSQKGPIWDEVSRIMSEEHGYQRTGKKCKEKFDNLYKYYKKTRDGKSGRDDGKNYRFFRQLEALYGDSKNEASFSGGTPLAGNCLPLGVSNNITAAVSNQESLQPLKLSVDSISFSKSSDFYTEKSDQNTTFNDDSCEKGKKTKNKKKWKAKVEDFIDSEMRNLMEKQDDWLEKMTRMIEDKEQERLQREIEWKKQEEFRVEREQNFWATQKSWIEGRNAALMEAMRNLTGSNELHLYPKELTSSRSHDDWKECEITCLIQLRTSMEHRFQQNEYVEGILWEEIAVKMAYMGYNRNGSMCKHKWETLSKHFMMNIEDSRTYYICTPNDEYTNGQLGGGIYSVGGNSNGIAREAQSTQQCVMPLDHHIRGGDGCYRSILGAAENLWLKDP